MNFGNISNHQRSFSGFRHQLYIHLGFPLHTPIIHHIKTTDKWRNENNPLITYSLMFCWETSGPGLRVDVTCTDTNHLNTAADQEQPLMADSRLTGRTRLQIAFRNGSRNIIKSLRLWSGLQKSNRAFVACNRTLDGTEGPTPQDLKDPTSVCQVASTGHPKRSPVHVKTN